MKILVFLWQCPLSLSYPEILAFSCLDRIVLLCNGFQLLSWHHCSGGVAQFLSRSLSSQEPLQESRQSIASLGNELFLLAIKDCDDLHKVKETALLKETNCIV